VGRTYLFGVTVRLLVPLGEGSSKVLEVFSDCLAYEEILKLLMEREEAERVCTISSVEVTYQYDVSTDATGANKLDPQEPIYTLVLAFPVDPCSLLYVRVSTYDHDYIVNPFLMNALR
jgi:hypothetical protein